MAVITLDRVTRSFAGGAAALRDVTWTIPDGAFCAIVGPSGAGKSTLLRLLARRDSPTAGFATVWDDAERRGAALMTGGARLNPLGLVYAAIAAGLRPERPSTAETETRTLAIAEELGLGPLLARRVGTLSGGERRTVALARTLVRRPGVFLLDEPFGDAGPALRSALIDAVRRVQRERRTTTVLATQGIEEAMRLADSLVVLLGGRIAQAGDPAAVFAAPATIAVARATSAIGLNVLPVRANQTGLSLEDGTTLGGASVMTRAVYALLAVRPEHLFALDSEGPPAAARLPVRVETLETTGADVLLRGFVGPHRVSARLDQLPEGAAAGATVMLGADRRSLHMFDAETEQRL